MPALAFHVQVCDTRLTIIVSLTKHIQHRPHSDSPKIVKHEMRLTFAELQLLRLRACSLRFYILEILTYPKGSFASKSIQLYAAVIRTILEIYSLYGFIHELRAILQVGVMIPKRSSDFSKLTLKVINYREACASSYVRYYPLITSLPIYFLIARTPRFMHSGTYLSTFIQALFDMACQYGKTLFFGSHRTSFESR